MRKSHAKDYNKQWEGGTTKAARRSMIDRETVRRSAGQRYIIGLSSSTCMSIEAEGSKGMYGKTARSVEADQKRAV